MDNNLPEGVVEFIMGLDDLINSQLITNEPHVVAGALLSRYILLMQEDPGTGKELAKYVWEQLDQIESGTKDMLWAITDQQTDKHLEY